MHSQVFNVASGQNTSDRNRSFATGQVTRAVASRGMPGNIDLSGDNIQLIIKSSQSNLARTMIDDGPPAMDTPMRNNDAARTVLARARAQSSLR